MSKVSEIQNKLFNKLTIGTEINLTKFPNIRVKLSKEQFDAVAHAKILQTYVFNREVIFMLLSIEKKNYLLFTGLNEALPEGEVEPIENKIELSIFMLANGPSVKNDDVSEGRLLEEIFTKPDVQDVEWNNIEHLFPQIQTHEIKVDIGETDPEQVFFLKTMALNALCHNKQVLILPFNDDTINRYVDVVACGNNEIPIDNVLRSLGSNYWKFCYIDIYRCIERLLLIGWVQNYHQKDVLKTLSPDDLFKCMYEILKVEHHEWENIEYLFNKLPSKITSILDPVVNGEIYYKYIYNLRNKLVHFQKDEKDINSISDNNWNVIIQFMLMATIELYKELDTYVKQLPRL